MFSQEKIRRLATKFVTISIDPRDPDVEDEPFKHKSHNYVPEVVFLDVRDGQERVVARLEDRTLDGVTRIMVQVLTELEN